MPRRILATIIGKDSQSISIVTNSANDSHVSAQIQDMLANVLPSDLSSVRSEKAKVNEELGAKLMAENQKLAERLTDQLQH